MDIDQDYYFLTATAQEIWQKGHKEGEDRMFAALYRVREEKFFRRVIYRNSQVMVERMTELAEIAFLKAWEDFSRDGKAGKNRTKERSYVWYFFGVFRNKFLTLLGQEQARLQAEVEFGSRHEVSAETDFELGAQGMFSPEMEAIFQQLGPDCRQILIWRFAEGLDHEEIARRKEVKLKTSVQALFRCKGRFLSIWRNGRKNFN